MVAKEAGLKYHPGARLVFSDGTPDILAYPQDRPGWGRLCRLLTTGNLRGDAALDADQKRAFTLDLLTLMEAGNRSGDQTLVLPSEYLEVVIETRA